MRLIDADAIKLRYTIGVIADDGIVCVPLKDVRKSIDETPTVDAVPVVRCKDCIHQRTTNGFYACHKFMGENVSIITNPNNYCSFGRRKENV